MKPKTLLVFFLAITVTLASCMHMESVPYAVSEVECKIGTIKNEHDYAGIHFRFYNNAEKTVSGFKCNFLVFDSSGESNPFIGSNILVGRYAHTIEASDMEHVVISLDSYIREIPNDPYVIDFFYISKIEYSDGSVWVDPYGAWMPGGV